MTIGEESGCSTKSLSLLSSSLERGLIVIYIGEDGDKGAAVLALFSRGYIDS